MSSMIVCLLGWACAVVFFVLWRATLRNFNKVSSYYCGMGEIYNRAMDRLDEALRAREDE